MGKVNQEKMEKGGRTRAAVDLRDGRAGVMRSRVDERGERGGDGGHKGVQKVLVVLQKRSRTVLVERERPAHASMFPSISVCAFVCFGALRVPASMQTHLCWCTISKKDALHVQYV